MAHPDTSFLVPCRHCADLMQEGEQFCPTCGRDQRAAVDSGSLRQAVGDPFDTASSETGFQTGLGLVRPDSLWRAEPLRGGAVAPPSERTGSPHRWLLATATALTALLLFALVHDSFFADPQRSAGDQAAAALRDIKGTLDQRQDAALQGGRPRTGMSQPPAVPLAEPRNGALGPALAEPAPPVASAPSAPTAPVAATPAPERGASTEKACNEAMAALALCRRN